MLVSFGVSACAAPRTITNDITTGSSDRVAAETVPEAFLKDGTLSSQPIGHFDFCKKTPAYCPANTDPEHARVELTVGAISQLADVTARVNKAYLPESDQVIYGQDEVWTYPKNRADCEDYALEKQRELEQAGWNPATLALTVVRRSNGEGHAVLTVRTTQGDLVLDNLNDNVLRWDETDYSFIKRQSTVGGTAWVLLNQKGSGKLLPAEPAMAAVTQTIPTLPDRPLQLRPSL